MKFRFTLLSLLLLCASAASALDREAFSFTNYDLNLQIEPEQHRLGVRGKVTLAQRFADSAEDCGAADFVVARLAVGEGRRQDAAVRHPALHFRHRSHGRAFGSDRHSACAHCAQEGPSNWISRTRASFFSMRRGSLGLACRRTRRTALDWDQIDAKFTAVRGAGYVAWYPIATEVANLSEGNSLVEVLGGGRTREAGSKMHLQICDVSRTIPTLNRRFLFNGVNCAVDAVRARWEAV